MKKFLVCMTIFLISVMMPFTSFSKETLSDDEMSSTTAQEGVSIDFGGNLAVSATSSNFAVTGQFLPAVQSWGDGDGDQSGVTTYNQRGYIGATSSMYNDPRSFVRFYTDMDIDVGTSGSVTKAFVHLPQVLVHPANWLQTLKLSAQQDLSDAQPALGTSWWSEFAVVVNPNHPVVGVPGLDGSHNGYISISPHATTGSGEGVEIGFAGTTAWGQGVLFAIPNTPVRQSWGDADGTAVGGYTGAGYIGANYITFNSMLVRIGGTMDIDVGTDASGSTAVIVGIPTINFVASNIDQHMALSNSQYFDMAGGTSQYLGTMHTEGININPSGSIILSAH